jgi:hypothetical protein
MGPSWKACGGCLGKFVGGCCAACSGGPLVCGFKQCVGGGSDGSRGPPKGRVLLDEDKELEMLIESALVSGRLYLGVGGNRMSADVSSRLLGLGVLVLGCSSLGGRGRLTGGFRGPGGIRGSGGLSAGIALSLEEVLFDVGLAFTAGAFATLRGKFSGLGKLISAPVHRGSDGSCKMLYDAQLLIAFMAH